LLSTCLGGDGISVLAWAEVSACAAPRVGLAPMSQLPLPGIRALVADPGVDFWPLCLSCSLEQMSACCTAKRFAVLRLAVPLKVVEFGRSSDQD